MESDVRIIVPGGAIPAGINQSIFFGVFLDETTLLQDIPDAPDKTIISPVIECGPHDIHLLQPVEIIVPHCLDLSKAKKEWITVYRCGQFSAEGNGSRFFSHFSLIGYAFLSCGLECRRLQKVQKNFKGTLQNSEAVFLLLNRALVPGRLTKQCCV